MDNRRTARLLDATNPLLIPATVDETIERVKPQPRADTARKRAGVLLGLFRSS